MSNRGEERWRGKVGGVRMHCQPHYARGLQHCKSAVKAPFESARSLTGPERSNILADDQYQAGNPAGSGSRCLPPGLREPTDEPSSLGSSATRCCWLCFSSTPWIGGPWKNNSGGACRGHALHSRRRHPVGRPRPEFCRSSRWSRKSPDCNPSDGNVRCHCHWSREESAAG